MVEVKYFAVLIVVIATFCISESESKCENPAAFPVMYGSKYLCSVFYQERGHPDAFFGCNGEPRYTEEEVYFSAPDTQFYPIGSIVVKAGCSFYGYKDFNYQGEKHIFKGPVVLSEAPGLVTAEDPNYPDGFRSFMCDCDMNYINCVPSDNFEVVLYCDASSASVDTTCRYSKTIGTSFSSSISDSMSIDSTIEASMSASFFDLFEATLSTSVSTGYNWATTSEETKSEQVTVEVDAVAPAGQILTIEQAVGHCDGSSVKTEMYKISHFTPKGELISTKIVHQREL